MTISKANKISLLDVMTLWKLYCINRFTSLCKNLFNLLEFLAEAFRCHVHHFQCLTVPPGSLSIENDAHEKLLLKTQVNKFLHSEVNLLIQHVRVQNQDGQNNAKYNSWINILSISFYISTEILLENNHSDYLKL